MKGYKNSAVPIDQLLDAELTPENVRARRSRLHEPRVEPLTRLVQTMRRRLTQCQSRTVCDFDPAGGGINAGILFLLQDPSSTASRTGFISPDNSDNTAFRTTQACAESKIPPEARVHWNAYPFWLSNPLCPTTATRVWEQCARFLTETLELLTQLRAVVTVGNPATEAWSKVNMHWPRLRSFEIPHPSYGWWGKTLPDGRLGSQKVRDQLSLGERGVAVRLR